MVSRPHKSKNGLKKKHQVGRRQTPQLDPGPTNWLLTLLTICQVFCTIIFRTMRAVVKRHHPIACSLDNLKNANRLLTFLANY